MKFLSLALIPLLSGSQAQNPIDTLNEQTENGLFLTGEQILGEEELAPGVSMAMHDGSILNNTVRYDGSCEAQSHCLGLVVTEVQRRCGSGTCEYFVCYSTQVGDRAASAWLDAYDGTNGDEAATYAVNQCLQHAELGVDYACNTNVPAPDEDTGGCLNTPNSAGKGVWDEYTTNPEVTDEEGVTTTTEQTRFSDFCQVVAPGHTVQFLMHSHNSLDWNGDDPQPIGACTGTAEVAASGEADKFGSSKCAPSSINGANGQTYFPASDGSSGGTCTSEPEGVECVWSYTAPNECRYEENNPTCYITQASVDTKDTLCPGNSVVEYFEHPGNPNDPPPRVPIHNIAHNGDGTVSFNIYNPYGNYSEPIAYDGTPCDAACDLLYGPGGSYDLHDLYVVYDQANEIGNEVCELETAAGKCASDNTYTAKCRSDGVSVVTIFASGKDATSAAAGQITNGVGTDVFECCPKNYDPNFQADSTAAWTFLIHCDCPDDNVQDRRRLRKDDISSKFQRGELFSENQKKLHKLL